MDYISSFMKFTTRYLLLKSVSKPEAEIRDWDWLGFSDWLERKACADLSVLVYGTLRYNEIKDNCPCGQLCKSFPVSVKHCVGTFKVFLTLYVQITWAHRIICNLLAGSHSPPL